MSKQRTSRKCDGIARQAGASEGLHPRDAIFAALSFVAEKLLSETDWETSIQAVLERLGQAAEVSRVYIFENYASPDGEPRSRQRYEWAAPGVAPQIGNPQLQSFSWKKFETEAWSEALRQGKAVQGEVAHLAEPMRSHLAAQGIQSVLAVPIFAGSTWWGWIGFDDCGTARSWHGAETDALRSAARTLGAALSRRNSEESLRKANAMVKAVVEASPLAIVALDVRGNVCLWNPAAEGLFGWSEAEILGGPLPTVPLEDAELHRTIHARSMRGEATSNLELRRKRKDGSFVDIQLSTASIFDAHGKVTGHFGMMKDVSQRKAAEAALLRERHLFRTLLDNLPEHIYFKDRESRFTLINRALANRFGLADPALAVGKTDADFFAGEHAGQALADELDIMRTSRPIMDREEKETWLDGHVTWVSSTKMPLRDVSGEIIGTFGISRDCTERKRLESTRAAVHRIAQASLATDSLEEFFRATHAAVAELMPARNLYIALDDAAADILSWSYYIDERDPAPAPRAKGRGFTEYILRTGKPCLAPPELIQRLAKDGEIVISGTIPSSRLGVPLTVNNRTVGALVVQDYSGAVLYGANERDSLMAIADQVAKAISRKRVEEERRLLQTVTHAIDIADEPSAAIGAVLQDICQSTGWGMGQAWRPSDDRKLLVCEPAWYASGTGAEQLRALSEGSALPVGSGLSGRAYVLKRRVWAQNVGALADPVRAPFVQAAGFTAGLAVPLLAGSEVVAVFEFFLPQPRAEDQWFLEVVANVAGKLGEAVLRKQAQAAMRQAKEAAEAATRVKGDFLANVSHEIRTPLNGILGMTELLLDSPLAKDQLEYLTMLKSATESLLTLVNDILDFSKVEAGKMVLDAIEFRLSDCLGQALKALAVRAQQRGLELACHVAPEVPEFLVGDPGRLRQIILNLVGNAIKFTEKGEVVVEVRVDSQDQAHATVHFSVRDTGIGIPADMQKTIFEPFEQADPSTTRRYGGTGLGLAIATRLLHLMDGRIWVESAPGEGSTFHFTVPMAFGRMTGAAQTAAFARLKNLPVLVVDDNHTNRFILAETVKRWKMVPTAAESAKSALVLLEESKRAANPFALILLDAQMPEMDGFTFAARVREDRDLAGTPILILTSGGKSSDVPRCHELDVAGYLTKPVGTSELLEAVLLALGTKSGPSVVPGQTVSAPAETPRKLHVLVAEDNPINQALVTRLLEKRGHTVQVANNGKEALAALEARRDRPFDLILMDMQMPEMDGPECVTQVRAREKGAPARLPILALTAHAMKGDRERFMALGVDGYVPKPVRAEELFAAIDSVLNRPVGPSANVGGTVSESVLDRQELLRHFEDDKSLLGNLIGVFVNDFPGLVATAREAAARKDPVEYLHTTQVLMSNLALFAAPAAYEAARQAESVGRIRGVDQTGEALARLEEELERLQPVLSNLGKEVSS